MKHIVTFFTFVVIGILHSQSAVALKVLIETGQNVNDERCNFMQRLLT